MISIQGKGTEKKASNSTGFTEEDVCLGQPAQCPLVDDETGHRGMSMSLWANIPHDLDTRETYLVDTGGDDVGTPGIAIKVCYLCYLQPDIAHFLLGILKTEY